MGNKQINKYQESSTQNIINEIEALEILKFFRSVSELPHTFFEWIFRRFWRWDKWGGTH